MTLLPLTALLLGLLSSAVAAPSVAPSFDCQSAATAREIAVCNDPALAQTDRELDAAWRAAIAKFDKASDQTAAAKLRDDQRRFLQGLDDGFDAELWGKAGPPDDDTMRARALALSRDGDDHILGGLDAQLRERIAFLRALSPAISYAGLWKSADAEMLIAPGTDGRFQVSFGTTTYGWFKYHCHFTGDEFQDTVRGLVSERAHNSDPEIDDDVVSTLIVARQGDALTLTEIIPENADPAAPHHICPREPGFGETLFHTDLKEADARRLDPGE
jgi:uncharacterized protein YecT (DUF1311 family)